MRITLLLVFLLLQCLYTFSANRYWKGGTGSKSWQVATNWNTMSDGSGSSGIPASGDDVFFDVAGTVAITLSTPANANAYRMNSVSVSNGAVITLQANYSMNATVGFTITSTLSIDAASTLNWAGSTTTSGKLFLDFGGTATIFGKLILSGTLSSTSCDFNWSSFTGVVTIKNGGHAVLQNNGSFNAPSATKLVFESGSFLDIERNGAVFPTASWDANSTINVTGTTTTGPSHQSSVSYGNLIWDCSGQSAAATMGISSSLIVFNGTVSIKNSNGQTVRFGDAPNVQINGLFTIGNIPAIGSALFSVSGNSVAGTINLKGDVDVKSNGTITEVTSSAASVIIFSGTSAQSITSTGTLLNQVTYRVNNSFNLSLLSNVTIPATSTLDLTLGKIILGSYNLTIAGSILNGSSSSYVVTDGSGSLTKNAVSSSALFPVGVSTSSYSPLTINNTGGYNWSVRTETGINPAPNVPFTISRAILRTWTITPSVNPPASNTLITFQWNEADAGILAASYDGTKEVVAHRHTGTAWNPFGNKIFPTGSAGGIRTYTAIKSANTNYSPFAISNYDGLLPTLFLNFNVSKFTGYHRLNFSASCAGAYADFEIQRSSDGRNFTAINSFRATQQRCGQPFEIIDESMLAGKNYYRIKMRDASGLIVYSGTQFINYQDANMEIIGVFPNRTAGTTYLNISTSKTSKLLLHVIAVDGRVLMQKEITLQQGVLRLPLDLSALAAGTYFIRCAMEDLQVNTFIVQKL